MEVEWCGVGLVVVLLLGWLLKDVVVASMDVGNVMCSELLVEGGVNGGWHDDEVVDGCCCGGEGGA